MPSYPRSDVIQKGKVQVLHLYNRCVRQAWLTGVDPITGVDYEYRRQWIVERERRLAALFGVEIGFHSEMSNHLHLIVRTRPDVVEVWSDEEVVRRWLTFTKLTQHFNDSSVEPLEGEVRLALADAKAVDRCRRRLSDVSWFMGLLEEYISRRSNREDGRRGHFWEGRFECQDLADESAILICGMYVDLNPIRAGEALIPEEAKYTSAYDRIQARQQQMAHGQGDSNLTPSHEESQTASQTMPPDGWLSPLTLKEGPDADVREGLRSKTPWRASDKGLLPLSVDAYLTLLDWSGRQLRAGKPGAIPENLAPILERLRIREDRLVESIRHFEHWFGRALGRAAQLVDRMSRGGQRPLRSVRACAATFL
jgi:hypothetical protein